MNYNVAKGDCLWNIVKSNYNCNSSAEVKQIIDQITKDNGIKDANKIFVGQSIELPETDMFIKSNSEETSNIADFEEWTSSEENLEKSLNGEKVDDFEMFELDLSSYSKDLKGFSQEYVNSWDSDGDGKWNKEEFISMSTSGQEIPEDQKDSMNAMFEKMFNDLNLDDDKDSISAEEFATYLYASDMDWDNYAKTGDVASSIDGKLNYDNYQAFSALESDSNAAKTLKNERLDFFNNFYAE